MVIAPRAGEHLGRRSLLYLAMLAVALASSLLPLSLGLRIQPLDSGTPAAVAAYGKLPLSFEPNAGQTDPSVRFMARVPGGRMFFTSSEVVLALMEGDGKSQKVG